MVQRHAISGDENAGAIVTETAVYEDLLAGVIVENGEELDQLLIGGRRPAAYGDMDETDAQGFGALALPVEFFTIFAAQVNNGGDAEDFEFGKADIPGLGAAVKDFGDFPAVGNAIDVQLLAKSRLRKSGCGRLRESLRRSLREKRKRKSKEGDESEKSSFHEEAGTNSVA